MKIRWLVILLLLSLLVVPVSATQVIFTPYTNDTPYRYSANSLWADMRGGAGTDIYYLPESIAVSIAAGTSTDRFDFLFRGIVIYDTSSIPDDATIIDAYWIGYVSNIYVGLDEDFNTTITGCNPATPGMIVYTDYTTFNDTLIADFIEVDDMVENTNSTFTLNAAGRAIINKTGYTNIMTRSGNDALNYAPNWSSEGWQTLDFESGSLPQYPAPTLVVNYTTGSPVSHFSMSVVSQGGAPEAEFTVSNATPIVLQEVQFTDLSTGSPSWWYWEIQRDISGFVFFYTPNPVMHWHEPGWYRVQLTAYNQYGNDAEMKYNYIHVIDEEAPPGEYNNSIGGIAIHGNDYVWNVPVDNLPVLSTSATMIAQLPNEVLDLAGQFPINVVGDETEHVYFSSVGSPYSDPITTAVPIPADPEIEPGDWDKHCLIVDVDDHMLYEIYFLEEDGLGGWKCEAFQVLNLDSYALRGTPPSAWGVDTTGMEMVPGIIRADEIASGEIRHAIRFAAFGSAYTKIYPAYVWPARASMGDSTSATAPASGQRFRLKESVDISGFSNTDKIILQALKTYGMLLADNNAPGYGLGIAADMDVIDDGGLNAIHLTDFEAVNVSSLIIEPDSGQVGSPPDSLIIINSTTTDISQIPGEWITAIKSDSKGIDYAYTSHGAYVIAGLKAWENYNANYAFDYTDDGSNDLPVGTQLKIGARNGYDWDTDYWYGSSGIAKTEAALDTGDYRYSMFEWCTELSTASSAYVDSYLAQMETFESEYPDIRFIYTTQHADAGAADDGANSIARNAQIRAYAIANNKVLYDYEDIGAHSPSGTNYLNNGCGIGYVNSYADECTYMSGNWCNIWMAANPGHPFHTVADYLYSSDPSGCYHSPGGLQGTIKGSAFWWMMARLEGWNGVPT